jgi:putative endonuclease
MDPHQHHLALTPDHLRALAVAGHGDGTAVRDHAGRSGRSGGAGGSDRAETGRLGEELAVRHLVDDDGCEVVARNWRLGTGELRGELDIVAVDPAEGCVVVCEVKTRRDADRFGGAAAALGPRQHARLRRLTAAFLADARLPHRRVRLDLVAVDLGRRPSLTHLVSVW